VITKDDVLQSFDTRSSHLLDRVRETAKRCITAGVRLDLGVYEAKTRIETELAFDFLHACEAALFQLAEVAGSGEMYTKEDVDDAFNDGYSACQREMRYAVND
jgi:hypothetical protein